MCWNKAAKKNLIMYVIDDNGDRQKIDPGCKCSWEDPDVTLVRIDEDDDLPGNANMRDE